MSTPTRTCADCGAALPIGVLNGLCPRCLSSALNMSRILQGTFTAQPAAEPASAKDLAAEVRALTGTAEHLERCERIGCGGMGEVQRARDLKLARTVALKRLRPEREGQRGAVARFLAEARIASTLEHPGIVPIYDVGFDAEGHAYYTMRLVQGEKLSAVLERLAQGDDETLRGYPLATLLAILQQVCDAVAYAHSRGVIHRDLKPDNVMLGEFGQVMVMDWGLAKVLEQADAAEAGPAAQSVGPAMGKRGAGQPSVLPSPDGLTQPDLVMGSLGYMAPEQAGGRAFEADARADVYALGAILYHILTLRPPIRGRDARLMLDRTTGGDVRPPTDFNPGGPPEVQRLRLAHCPSRRVPAALSAVAMKAMATRPEDRYPSVEALRADVGNWLNGFPVSAEGAGLTTYLARWAKRHQVAVAATALVVLLVAAFSIHNWRTVRQLHGTAPTFARLAESLGREQKLEEALEPLTFALRLAPGEPRYLALKGKLLLGLLRIEEARAAFREAQERGSTDPQLTGDLEMCERLLAGRGRGGTIPSELLTDLYRMLVQADRPGEALAVFARMREQREKLLAFWRERLDESGIQGDLEQEADGHLRLSVTNQGIRDLSALAGMPLVSLRLGRGGNSFTNLSPLRGMPLKELSLCDAPVSDLRPLTGMPLVNLHCWGARYISDLTPLHGMRLHTLSLHRAAVTDLAPLQGMPIRLLDLSETKVCDFSPLSGSAVQNLELDGTPFTNLLQLAALPLGKLDLSGTDIRDISPLGELPLQVLYLNDTDVSDLGPLKFMPLGDRLELANTRVGDISVLRGKPLRVLRLDYCTQLRDLSPLADCRELEELHIRLPPRDLQSLRDLAKLGRINGLPAAEFWRDYDARKATQK